MQVKVVGMTGNYFQVQSLGGRTIRGYVHREDAFFARSEDSDLQSLSKQTIGEEKKPPVILLPSPILYRVIRDTTLVARKDGERVSILKGTKVRVAGFTREDKAFVVSRWGNPDGFIPKANLEEVPLRRSDTTKTPTEPPNR
jgi:hypothetical protein